MLHFFYHSVPELTNTIFEIIALFIRCDLLIQVDQPMLEPGFFLLNFLEFLLRYFRNLLHILIKSKYWLFEHNFIFLFLWQEEALNFWNFLYLHLKQKPSTISLLLWQNNRYLKLQMNFYRVKLPKESNQKYFCLNHRQSKLEKNYINIFCIKFLHYYQTCILNSAVFTNQNVNYFAACLETQIHILWITNR